MFFPRTVPDAPDALTSNAGWNTKTNKQFLQNVIGKFQEAGIRTSIFVDADEEMIFHAKETGTNRVELYTESFANGYSQNKEVAQVILWLESVFPGYFFF